MAELEPKVVGLYSAETSLTKIHLDQEGIIGSKYHGAFAEAGVREPQLPHGSEIRNRRQITIIDISELTEIANILKLPFLTVTHLRPDIVTKGLPLTQNSSGTMLRFPGGVIIEVEGFNDPCSKPAKYIVEEYPHLKYEEFKENFKNAAKGRRGIIATVYYAGDGIINLGDRIQIERYRPQHTTITTL